MDHRGGLSHVSVIWFVFIFYNIYQLDMDNKI